jgi:hypothetical protein
MEDPQPSLPAHKIESVQPIHKMNQSPRIAASPEHSRARSKRIRAAGQPAYNASRPQIRRRESYADGTRRGRSRTRSVSPTSAKRRTMRRRRSRSPSRSCSTSATETQSTSLKRQRGSQNSPVNSDDPEEASPELPARDESRECMRSRSKRRKKYRRRSDYAAIAAEVEENGGLRKLQSVMSTDTTRTESFESVLEEDEEAGGETHQE